MAKQLAVFVSFWAASIVGAEQVDFARDIRPILSDRCFKCHGLDEGSRKAKLALHQSAMATKDGAIVPGDAAKSLMIQRILSTDPDEMMPPPSANKPRLTAAEVEKFKNWINAGAKYEEHWAFVPPRRTLQNPPPSASGNPIDGFVESALKKQEMSFSRPADSYTLIRRIYLDLIGLPPTPRESKDFVAFHKADPKTAVERVVDDLLGRPEYGERWARLWLDLARYADTNGYEKDRPRSIWPYRDWVIHALNSDMPYDQFSIEQLAGDMLPNATLSQRIATGFHRNTMINEEGGIDPLEFRFNAMVDRVATTGTVWMGLTTGCAQCHTHKFDPITHHDYYALFALLNNADEPELDVPSPELGKKRERIESEIAKIEQDLVSKIDPQKFNEWKSGELHKTAPWTTLRPVEMKSTLPRLELMADDSIFASGDFTKREVYDLKFEIPSTLPPITAIRIEALPDDRLPAHGPGAAYYEGRKGDFFLSEVKAKADRKPVFFRSADIDFGKIAVGSGKALGANVFDNNGSSGWSTATEEGKRHELVINLEAPLTQERLDLRLIFERHFVAALGRFRISVTNVKKEVKARGGEIPDLTKASDSEWQKLYINHSGHFAEQQARIGKLRQQIPALPTTMVMREWNGATRKSRRHHRGEYLQPKEEVSPAVPAIFKQLPSDKSANRLALAKWLVSEDNPLVARVAVNRAWRAFFGRGIVHTAGDFGYQSELPSHPALLDFLAVTFIDQGWSMKELHRLIVTSQTYQQDSTITSQALAKDFENIYLARGPRFRLDGEILRDTVLHGSGLLVQKIGGPSVYPPQLPSVAAAAYGGTKWPVSKGADRYRRSLYTFMKRTAPFAAYLSFDGPTGESCLPRRERSNTPLQALTLLNDEMFTEASIALVDGVNYSGSEESIAQEIVQKILSRPPTDSEIGKLVEYYKAQLVRLSSGEIKSSEIVGAKGKTDPRRAAWSMVARALFNLDEAITKG